MTQYRAGKQVFESRAHYEAAVAQLERDLTEYAEDEVRAARATRVIGGDGRVRYRFRDLEKETDR